VDYTGGRARPEYANARSGDLLFDSFTVDDPDALMEPWTSITYARPLNPNPARQDEAPICEERDIDLLADPYNRG
jgi:hypothetical protein